MIKFVCFDLNGTLISDHTWFDLNTALGVTSAEDRDLMDGYRNGIFSYIEGQKRLALLYKKHGKATKDVIVKTLSGYSLADGAREVISYLQAKGYRVALLSNSVDLLVSMVASRLQIPIHSANNSFLFEADGRLSEIAVYADEMQFKWIQLADWCRAFSILPGECAFVGNGDDDRESFIRTKHGIAFEHSPLSPVAWKVIRMLADIRQIL